MLRGQINKWPIWKSSGRWVAGDQVMVAHLESLYVFLFLPLSLSGCFLKKAEVFTIISLLLREYKAGISSLCFSCLGSCGEHCMLLCSLRVQKDYGLFSLLLPPAFCLFLFCLRSFRIHQEFSFNDLTLWPTTLEFLRHCGLHNSRVRWLNSWNRY